MLRYISKVNFLIFSLACTRGHGKLLLASLDESIGVTCDMRHTVTLQTDRTGIRRSGQCEVLLHISDYATQIAIAASRTRLLQR